MSAVAVHADRRFRRSHVKPARPARHRHPVFWRALRYALLTGVLAYAAHLGVGFVAHARVLQIDRIIVRGNERLSSGEVLAVLNGLRGENLIGSNLDQWRRRLLSSPWIRDASLRRSLPSTVEVNVSERQPIGIGRIDGQMYLIDERGVVIDDYGPQYAQFDLPIIDGLSAPSGRDAAGNTGRADLASRVIVALRANADVARGLSQIDVHNPHNAAVIMNGYPAVIQLGEERFLERIQSYLELAPTLQERVANIDYVDVRFDGRIYVRPLERSSRTRGAAAKARAKAKAKGKK
jgi:cell division protein FtsQ